MELGSRGQRRRVDAACFERNTTWISLDFTVHDLVGGLEHDIVSIFWE